MAHRPYAIKVELVRGCTQRCPFCSLPNMPWAEAPWQFMSPRLFKAMVDELAVWLPGGIRIEFEGRGEPSFHPHLQACISYARERYPRCQLLMTSNGDMVKKQGAKYAEWIRTLLEAGLNVAMLDCYTQARYDDFRARFPEAKLFFEDGIHPYAYHGPALKRIILMNAIAGQENIIRKYHNQGGTVNPIVAGAAGFTVQMTPAPLQRMCVRPFRELVLWSDGAMPICCNDWLPANIIGMFPAMPLQQCWTALDPARRALLQRNRGALRPCDVCTERAGFRVGLESTWFRA